VIRDERCHSDWVYEQLMSKGFRRSGNEIYRPHCPGCQACQSIRIPVAGFTPSRGQKRVLNKCNSHFTVTIDKEPHDQCYPLYQKYINLRHHDGSMYPASVEQYEGFLFCDWLQSQFLHLWDEDKLIGVAVTDVLPNALSAIYTFFDPDYEKYSIGTYCLLQQINACLNLGKEYLYLGYQIEECQKMNYKTKYKPYQRLIRAQWINFT
jgi:arginine-tRNA-protein transferase